ncbi:MAG: hypothetical protein K5854_01585 [Prevotella sp.]|nr:hypothetical protein [Prevotella sp.]
MTNKTDFVEIFSGLSSVMFQKNLITVTQTGEGENAANTVSNILPDFDLPVEVDTFNFEQSEPDIQHFKIIGLQSDWATQANIGDTTLALNIPATDDSLLKAFWGDDAVKAVTATKDGASFEGNALTLKKKQIKGSIILMNEAQDKLLILRSVVLYATPVYGDTGTKPFEVKLNGSIANDGGDDILFLKKTV